VRPRSHSQFRPQRVGVLTTWASTSSSDATTVRPTSRTIRGAVAEGLKEYEKGEFRRALSLFEQSLSLSPEKDEKAEKQAAYYDMACCYSKLKQPDNGLQALETAIELGYDEAKQIMADPDLATLRKAEGFQTLMRQISGGDASSSSTSNLDLEAEVRNPFRRFRQFVWGGAAVASGLGSAVSLTQTIGALAGKETIPLEQAAQNLGVNTGIAVGMLFLLNLEGKGNEKDKEQIAQFREVLSNATERVRKMSAMKVSIKSATSTSNSRGFSDSEAALDTRTTTLREFRAGDTTTGPRKIVILAGNGKFIQESLRNAKKADAKGVSIGSSKFGTERVAVIPVVMAEPGSKVMQMPRIGGKDQLDFVAVPQEMERWRSLLAQEFKYGYEQGNKNIFSEGIVLATDELGRVVQRGVGLPTIERWEEAFDKWWK